MLQLRLEQRVSLLQIQWVSVRQLYQRYPKIRSKCLARYTLYIYLIVYMISLSLLFRDELKLKWKHIRQLSKIESLKHHLQTQEILVYNNICLVESLRALQNLFAESNKQQGTNIISALEQRLKSFIHVLVLFNFTSIDIRYKMASHQFINKVVI